jgi:hypothetical protein
MVCSYAALVKIRPAPSAKPDSVTPFAASPPAQLLAAGLALRPEQKVFVVALLLDLPRTALGTKSHDFTVGIVLTSRAGELRPDMFAEQQSGGKKKEREEGPQLCPRKKEHHIPEN